MPLFCGQTMEMQNKIVGGKVDQDTDDKVIMLQHEIPHRGFSAAVVASLPSDDCKPEAAGHRIDLTHLDVFSVDPEGCTDIDEAFHCVELGNDRFEIGVHIADVTELVYSASGCLEGTGQPRNVYLRSSRLNLIPKTLSSNMFSLIGGKDSCAFSVIWVMREDASIESVNVTKSIIRSRSALTYQSAQKVVTDANNEYNDGILKSLRNLMKLSRSLNSKRKAALAVVEVLREIDWDAATMVDEMMFLAKNTLLERMKLGDPSADLLPNQPIFESESFKPKRKGLPNEVLHATVDLMPTESILNLLALSKRVNCLSRMVLESRYKRCYEILVKLNTEEIESRLNESGDMKNAGNSILEDRAFAILLRQLQELDPPHEVIGRILAVKEELRLSILNRLLAQMSFEDVVNARLHPLCPLFAKEALKKRIMKRQ